jgi:alpha-tubulin suppressor-like RCC1 family protein
MFNNSYKPFTKNFIYLMFYNAANWLIEPNYIPIYFEYSDISAGNTFWVGINKDNGSGWGTGINSSGQLGQLMGSATSYSSPVSVVGGFSFSQISCGDQHCIGINGSNGSGWGFGQGGDGRLGNNSTSYVDSPTSVLGGFSFKQISCGYNFSAGIVGSNGSAWAWGSNTYGQLGDNTLVSKMSPISVVGGFSFSQISCGYYHTLAINGADGSCWGWGQAANGKLAKDIFLSVSSPYVILNNMQFTQIDAGVGNYSAGIRSSDGSIWSWGINTYGQLGNNTRTQSSIPVSVVGGMSFTQLAVGHNHIVAIRGDGTCWAWGYNVAGQLGDFSRTSRSSPASVRGGFAFSKIAAGDLHSIGIRSSDGTAWAWGSSSYGQIGNNTRTSYSSPISVVGGFSFIEVTAGTTYTMGIVGVNGTLRSWGRSNYGQLGHNSATVSVSSPVSAVGGFSFKKISGYDTHSLGILGANGAAYAWGYNAAGQLGDFSRTNRSSPASVRGGFSFSNIATGTQVSLFINGANGNGWACGINTYGQLGNNTTTSYSSPVSVAGGFSFKQVMTGNLQSVSIIGDNTGYSWGSNTYGQLGICEAIYQSPISIQGGFSFTQIYAGQDHSVGIRGSDGSAWAWGSNTYGQLGDYTRTNRVSPVSVVGGFSFSSISVGLNECIGINGVNGSAWSWGNNTDGQLGNNTRTSYSSPISVVGGLSFSNLKIYGSNSIGIINQFTTFTWGSNSYGQLGVGSSSSVSSPIPVWCFCF